MHTWELYYPEAAATAKADYWRALHRLNAAVGTSVAR